MTAAERRQRARAAVPRRLGPHGRGGELRPSHLGDVRSRPARGARGRLPPLRLLAAEEPGQRPPGLLEGPRVGAPVRDVPRRGRRHGRRDPHLPQVRQHARGTSDAAHSLGRRRDRLARPGPPDRCGNGARGEASRAPPDTGMGALRRQRDGRGLDVGGLRARRPLRARQPHCDHRREPPRPARRDDGRLEPRRLRRARGSVRLERDRGGRARRRRNRRGVQPSRRDGREAHRRRRTHAQGKGRHGRREPERLARQAARGP